MRGGEERTRRHEMGVGEGKARRHSKGGRKEGSRNDFIPTVSK